MPRRSKRTWSIMPASSGLCSSPGFMKPTNSQVSAHLSALAVTPAMQREGGYMLVGAWSSRVLLLRGYGDKQSMMTSRWGSWPMGLKPPLCIEEGSQVIDGLFCWAVSDRGWVVVAEGKPLAGASPHGPSPPLVFAVIAGHALRVSPELILSFPELPGVRATGNPGVQLSALGAAQGPEASLTPPIYKPGISTLLSKTPPHSDED